MMDPDNKGHVSLSSKTYGCKQLTVLEVLRKLEQKLHTLYFIFDVALQFRNNDYGNNVNLEFIFIVICSRKYPYAFQEGFVYVNLLPNPLEIQDLIHTCLVICLPSETAPLPPLEFPNFQ